LSQRLDAPGIRISAGNLTSATELATRRKQTTMLIQFLATATTVSPSCFSATRTIARSSKPVVHHTQCGAGLLADSGFRQQAAAATGLSEPELEATAVTDPEITVKADVERLLASPLLSPKVSVSGHAYDIANRTAHHNHRCPAPRQ
jgi:hypothetical protein